MKRIIVSAVMVVSIHLLVLGIVSAQNSDDNKGGSGMRDARERRGDIQTLTDQQKAAVKSILSQYNPSTLKVSDAKAIHSAFRDAGVRKGPGLNEAVKAAGFDPDKLRNLDPPHDIKNRENGMPDDKDRNDSGRDGKQDRQIIP